MIFSLLFFLVGSPTEAGHSKKKRRKAECSVEVALADVTRVRGAQSFILPPHSVRYLVGSLIRTEKAKSYLAVGGYRLRHWHLHEALNFASTDEIDPLEFGKFTYEWLGELKIENDRDEEAPGVIKVINEMAGFFGSTLVNLEGQKNSAWNLDKRLRRYVPSLVGKSLKVVTYQKALRKRTMHLMPGLDDYIERLEELKRTDLTISRRENYRHYIGNKVDAIYKNLTMALGTGADPSWLTKTEQIIYESPLALDSLRLFLEVLENDGMYERQPKEGPAYYSEIIFPLLIKLEMREMELADWMVLLSALENHATSTTKVGSPESGATTQQLDYIDFIIPEVDILELNP